MLDFLSFLFNAKYCPCTLGVEPRTGCGTSPLALTSGGVGDGVLRFRAPELSTDWSTLVTSPIFSPLIGRESLELRSKDLEEEVGTGNDTDEGLDDDDEGTGEETGSRVISEDSTSNCFISLRSLFFISHSALQL